MAEIVVSGIPVSFPFPPYPAQVEYMQSVIQCLQTGANGLLESPTGTGKTLCLLCGTLGWLAASAQPTVVQHNRRSSSSPAAGADRRRAVPHKVVYCSRTHAQLTQVVRELKRTAYGARFTMALLGSREHMCVNREVTRLPSSQAQQAMCGALRTDRNCRFFRGLQSATAGASLLPVECAVHDMEDLVREGRKSGFCPYYHERDAAKDADLVLMPYNYVLDPSLHKQLPFDLAHCILIVDEAHNLPSVLSSAGCLSLSPLDVATAIHDCSRAMAMQRVVAKREEMEEEKVVAEEQEVASLKILLSRLETCLYEEPMAPNNASNVAAAAAASSTDPCDVVRDGAHIFEFLEKALITRDVFGGEGEGASGFTGLSGAMSRCVTLLVDSERPATSIVRVQEFLTAVFASDPLRLDSTRFVLQQHLVAGKRARTLGFWELDNTYLMRQVAAPLHSILLTSGTLSPLDQFAAELGMAFEVQLSGSHVIQPDQVLGGVLCRGPSGQKLNGGFAFRSSVDYRVGLGMSLVNITRNTPGGTLVFFPSYAAMNSAVDLWRAGSGRVGDTKTVWGLLSELKPVFVEPSNSSDLPAIVQGFQKEVDTSPLRGAILLAVCRGKISEGIDFADNHGRCVLVTGIPYANHTDLFVRLKRDYITAVAPTRPLVHGKPFTGDDWYRNEAMRAVNQCIGRVIRHKDDYGIVIFCDERFENVLGSISDWVRQRTRVFRDFRGAYAAVAQFFAGYRQRTSALATAVAAVPYVVLPDPAAAAGVADVPSSAILAKHFAEAQAQQREEQQQDHRRRRLEEVREAKASAVPAAVSSPLPPRAPAPFAASGGGASYSVLAPLPSAAAPHRVRALLSVVTPPNAVCVDDSAAGPPTIGSTSKEFCEFVKARVPGEVYNRFKVVLAQLAALRPVMSASPSTAAERMEELLIPLQAIFTATDAVHYRVIFAEFGRHIPEVFRPLYATLLKSHQLT
ncbi:putative helicase [Leptomonas pyrrhocoris]|uniref:Putative helicase n=1 Tax=Leptomonas pyrrhocoris TaxID=157538 RepID=A0A0M9G273_LEPPY|nr:putative helicase [Leptomonas pyrrhocoris]XP_015659136.1 putative helicase [Leptomonas pyrrhocoris]KPA80696.1 putative helicase [Leptomonas pyrrhocoris]KPA80697.1 putative helicase [Leptomonas pyrrhocoris]|eukprot:XP_015659135.1 putative helicase [Leptomonas pyrrhocoris]